MKKPIAAFLVMFGMAAFFQANSMEEPAHAKKSKEEMQIMKGILNTTLSYAVQSLAQQGMPTASSKTNLVFRSFSPINAFHLTGQGVVFVIPTGSLRTSGLNVFSEDLGEEIAKQLESSISNEEISNQLGLVNGSLTTSQGPPAQDPSTLTGEELQKKKVEMEKLQAGMQKLREKADKIQSRIQKRREEDRVKREKLIRNLAEIKSRLIETLANYGDSFTTIKPDEYINLALTSENGFNVENEQSSYQTVSIKRSWITDYKTGRLTLDSFKQKVLNYNE